MLDLVVAFSVYSIFSQLFFLYTFVHLWFLLFNFQHVTKHTIKLKMTIKKIRENLRDV